jgi:acyl-CoA reductase-like NAD-dependent aldehyde dehydrogenase
VSAQPSSDQPSSDIPDAGLRPVGADEITVVSPATLGRVGSVRVTEPAELEEILAEARHAQGLWAREPFATRKAVLRRVAREIVAHDLALARLIVDETGKPLVEAYTHDLFVAVEELMWLADRLEGVLSQERLPFPQLVLKQKRGWVHHEPVGVVGIISPWNFPLGLPLTQVATAVAAGNAVVLKPSELTPLVGEQIEALFRRAGAPPGLVRVVQGDGESIGAALVGHRQVDALVFTGSTEVGRIVARRAGERLCPVTLELGGKDPMLVLEDADLDRAVEGALWGSFANCGQICSGVERIYVHRTHHDAFVERLADRAKALRIGDGRDPGIELGPLISEKQRARVEGLVTDAIDHGARLVTGGGRPATGLPGWFHEPTILSGEPASARLRDEELFGPVVTVASFDNDDEAVLRANESRYALGASIWTRDVKRGRELSRRVRAGSVWLNDHLYSFSAGQAPWGGLGASGLGRTHGRQGLESMSHVKFTDSDRGWISPGWWYPYSERVVDGFRGVLGGLHAEGAGARVKALSEHRRGLAHLLRKALS